MTDLRDRLIDVLLWEELGGEKERNPRTSPRGFSPERSGSGGA